MPINTTESHPSHNTVESAARELRLALTRYDRLASPPRCLQYPILGCGLAAARAVLDRAPAGERRDQLADAVDREARRVARLAAWRGRSADAWAAIECRLWNARQDAVAAGVLDRASESYRAVSDRYRDAQRRRETERAREAAPPAPAIEVVDCTACCECGGAPEVLVPAETFGADEGEPLAMCWSCADRACGDQGAAQ